MPQLNIYKASAGSGKTFQLTGEYLKLLFKNIDNFRQTIAVTFTNKATDEMKSRILKEIFILSQGEKSNYSETLMQENSLSEKDLQKVAKKILFTVLHNYSWFAITTIDSFFQTVVRSFTREIGLQVGFDIEINQDKIIETVSSLMFKDLKNNKNLMQWIENSINEAVRNGDKWDIRQKILSLSKEVFKEDYKKFGSVILNKFSNKDFLDNYISDLRDIQKEFLDKMFDLANEGNELIRSQALSVDDFSYGKSGFANYFNKVLSKDLKPNSRVLKFVDGGNIVAAKASANVKNAAEAIQNDLIRIMNSMISIYEDQNVMYESIEVALKNVQQLGVLIDFSKYLYDYTRNENLFVLSDSAELINKIIDDNPSPFIYEKLGNTFTNYMIDEFQDTSSMQWYNFQPLIENSISEGNYGLIVGDVKQSIYRWRNGDLNLLDYKVEDYFGDASKTNTLTYNWRSKSNVISYNNSIYHYIPQIIQLEYNNEIEGRTDIDDYYRKQLLSIYSSAYQVIPNNKNEKQGNVQHSYIPSDDEYNEVIFSKIERDIINLQDKGYLAKDIAILVSKAKEGAQIADILMELKLNHKDDAFIFDFISNESLYLNNSVAIKIITNAIQVIIEPDNLICKENLVYEYYTNRDINISENNINYSDLPNSFIENIENLRNMSIYELTEHLIQIFELNKVKENYPYLEAFQDLIADYNNQNGSDLLLFLDWWNKEKETKVISVSEDQNAIKILTIHKSKGLEFKNVIIPYLDWELNSEKHGKILWVSTDEENIGKMDIIPVTYGKKLSDTIFAKDYYKEKLKTYIDSINKLYVATTRAEDSLIMYSKSNSKGKIDKLARIGDLLYYVYENSSSYLIPDDKVINDNYMEVLSSWNSDDMIFSYESSIEIKKEENNSNDRILEEYLSEPFGSRLKHKYHGEDYFDFEEKGDINEYTPISKGNILHAILENIITVDDIDNAINKLLFAGQITNTQIKSIKKEINKLLENDLLKDWFSGEWEIQVERDIITKNGFVLRPDRIMLKDNEAIILDYKSGKEERSEHKKQVSIYCNVLKSLGYSVVSGYLWYIHTNKLVKVS